MIFRRTRGKCRDATLGAHNAITELFSDHLCSLPGETSATNPLVFLRHGFAASRTYAIRV
jgi:hypothetical protein